MEIKSCGYTLFSSCRYYQKQISLDKYQNADIIPISKPKHKIPTLVTMQYPRTKPMQEIQYQNQYHCTSHLMKRQPTVFLLHLARLCKRIVRGSRGIVGRCCRCRGRCRGIVGRSRGSIGGCRGCPVPCRAAPRKVQARGHACKRFPNCLKSTSN